MKEGDVRRADSIWILDVTYVKWSDPRNLMKLHSMHSKVGSSHDTDVPDDTFSLLILVDSS